MRVRGARLVTALLIALAASSTAAQGGSAPASPEIPSPLKPEHAQALVDLAARHSPPGVAAEVERFARPVSASQEQQPEPWVAVPVPDLNGDGRGDVLDFRFSRGKLESFRMVLRNGADGEPLWHYTSAHHIGLPFVAHVGPQGELGIGVLEEHFPYGDPRYGMWVVALTAEGQKLFDEPIPEPYGRMHRVTDVLAGQPGRPAELLMEVTHQNPTFAWDHEVYTVSFATGTWAPRGATIRSLSEFNPTNAVGDLDGDGLPDIAIVYRALADRLNENWRVRLRLRSGLDHADVESVPAEMFDHAVGIRDVTGDGTDDVVVGASHPDGSQGWIVGARERPAAQNAESSDLGPARITLLDASAGVPLWTREGGHATWQGDINDDGIGDAVVWTVRHADAGTLLATAMTGAGERIYERELAVIDEVGGGRVEAWVYRVGDVDSDGVDDLLYEFVDDSGRPTNRVPGLHDGRTAELLRRERVQPLYASLDGSGPDVQQAQFDAAGERGEIVISDGLTGRRLVRIELVRPANGTSSGVVARHVDRDGCLDLLLNRRRSDSAIETYALSVSEESTIWRVRRDEESPRVGEAVVTQSAPLCGRIVAPGPRRPAPDRPAQQLPATGPPTPWATLIAVCSGAIAASHRLILRTGGTS